MEKVGEYYEILYHDPSDIMGTRRKTPPRTDIQERDQCRTICPCPNNEVDLDEYRLEELPHSISETV